MGGGGDIIRIQRAEKKATTNVDLCNVEVGDKVRILNKKSYIKALDHPWGRDYVEPCEEEGKTTLPCQDDNCD